MELMRTLFSTAPWSWVSRYVHRPCTSGSSGMTILCHSFAPAAGKAKRRGPVELQDCSYAEPLVHAPRRDHNGSYPLRKKRDTETKDSVICNQRSLWQSWKQATSDGVVSPEIPRIPPDCQAVTRQPKSRSPTNGKTLMGLPLCPKTGCPKTGCPKTGLNC